MSPQQIPALSLQSMHDEIREEALAAIQQVYDRGRFVLGPEVESFEREYAEYIGTKHCVTCASGLDALILSLRALEIGPGDRVIVPSNTYIASWLAVSAVGAQPVPVEPDRISMNLSVAQLDGIDPDTIQAIMPVHLYGRACPMHDLRHWAGLHDILVIEDNAQAHGAASGGKRTGSFGHVNAHSFYPSKNLGALGEGGAVTTDDADLAEKLRLLRNYGAREKYFNDIKGVNSRFDEIQAAFLRVKLRRLDNWNHERRRLAGRYLESLMPTGTVTTPSGFQDEEHVFHIYPILADRRDALRSHLQNQGVGTLIHYPVPPHLQKAYAELGMQKGDCPIAESMAERELSLPLYPGMTDQHIDRVVAAIADFYSAK